MIPCPGDGPCPRCRELGMDAGGDYCGCAAGVRLFEADSKRAGDPWECERLGCRHTLVEHGVDPGSLSRPAEAWWGTGPRCEVVGCACPGFRPSEPERSPGDPA